MDKCGVTGEESGYPSVKCFRPEGHTGDHLGDVASGSRYQLRWSPLSGIDAAWETPKITQEPSFSTGGYVKPKPELFVPEGGFVKLTEATETAIQRTLADLKTLTETPTHIQVLDEARRMLDEDRYGDYGDPSINFARIAAMWSAYLGVTITADQVGVMMTLMKCSRLAHSPDHRDSYVDGAAYLAIAAELQEG